MTKCENLTIISQMRRNMRDIQIWGIYLWPTLRVAWFMKRFVDACIKNIQKKITLENGMIAFIIHCQGQYRDIHLHSGESVDFLNFNMIKQHLNSHLKIGGERYYLEIDQKPINLTKVTTCQEKMQMVCQTKGFK